jgi:hypothetical protein
MLARKIVQINSLARSTTCPHDTKKASAKRADFSINATKAKTSTAFPSL